MNTKVVLQLSALIAWALVVFSLGWYGLSIMNNTCENNTIFTLLRILVVSGAIMIILCSSHILCHINCTTVVKDAGYFVYFSAFALSMTAITCSIKLHGEIGDCVDDSDKADTFKKILIFAGVIPSGVILVFSGYNFVKKVKEDAKKKKSISDLSAKEEKIREQKEKQEQLKKQLEEANKKKQKQASEILEKKKAEKLEAELKAAEKETQRLIADSKQAAKAESEFLKIEKWVEDQAAKESKKNSPESKPAIVSKISQLQSKLEELRKIKNVDQGRILIVKNEAEKMLKENKEELARMSSADSPASSAALAEFKRNSEIILNTIEGIDVPKLTHQQALDELQKVQQGHTGFNNWYLANVKGKNKLMDKMKTDVAKLLLKFQDIEAALSQRIMDTGPNPAKMPPLSPKKMRVPTPKPRTPTPAPRTPTPALRPPSPMKKTPGSTNSTPFETPRGSTPVSPYGPNSQSASSTASSNSPLSSVNTPLGNAFPRRRVFPVFNRRGRFGGKRPTPI